jgi:hypothetical protein
MMKDMAGADSSETKRPPHARRLFYFTLFAVAPIESGAVARRIRTGVAHGPTKRFAQWPGVELAAPIAPPRATHWLGGKGALLSKPRREGLAQCVDNHVWQPSGVRL